MSENDLKQENKRLKGSLKTYEILLKTNVEENRQLKEDYNAILKQRDDLIENATKSIEILNELKKWLNSIFDYEDGVISSDYLECYEEILNKIKELEG